MKLTVRETKKAIKNNQTVKFTLERNNARELTSNKKYCFTVKSIHLSKISFNCFSVAYMTI